MCFAGVRRFRKAAHMAPAARVQLARDDIPDVTCLTDAGWAVVAPFGAAPAGMERSWL